MALDPDDLRFVLAIARHGSLLGASKALGVDKATVIRRVDALESALSARVVERTATGWKLTPAGATVADTAEQVYVLLDELTGKLSSEATGIVRVTAPLFFAREVLMAELGKLRSMAPGIDLRLITTHTVLDLTKREADIAIRNVKPTQARVVARKLGTFGQAMYASVDYVKQRGEPKSIDELRGHHLLGYEEKMFYEPHWDAVAVLNLPVAFRGTDSLAVADGVRAGLGVAVLPCVLADGDATLVRLAAFGRSGRDIYLAYPDDLRDVPRIRSVIEWLVDVWNRSADAIRGESTQA